MPPKKSEKIPFLLEVETNHSKIEVPKLCPRPANPCSLGKEVTVKLNTWHIEKFPEKKVYQFDVSIMFKTPGPAPPKRGAMMKVWNSKTLQDRIGGGWLWDGNKAAW